MKMDQTLVSDIEQVVSETLETLCSRVSNLVASRKSGGVGESGDSEDHHQATIAALQTAMDIWTRSMSLTIAAKKFHKDKPPRIHQLPPEILIPALSEYLPAISEKSKDDVWSPDRVGSEIRNYFVQLYLLRRVCSAWRNLIDDHPPFWAYISQECPESIVAEALRKSKSALLFVSDAPVIVEGDYFAFMHQVSRHAHRWKTVVFRHIPSTEIARATVCVPAPALCKAFLKVVSDQEGAPPPVHLLAGQAECLRTLSVYALPVRWSPSFFANLKSFTIGGHHNGGTSSGISQRGLLQMIAEMPHLEELKISYPTLDYDGDTGISISKDVSPTDLRHLQHLKISELGGNLVHTFIKSFRIPACRDLSLFHQSSSPFDSLPEELLEAARHIILPALRGSKTSSITLSARNDTERFNWESSNYGDDAFSFWLSFQGLPCHRWIWLMDQFYTCVSSDISLDLQGSAIFSDLSLLFCPAKWHTTTSITLWSGHNAGSFLRYLTQPTTERGSSFAWPFEGLRCLILSDNMDCGQELYEFIKTRWQTPQSASKEDTARSKFKLSVTHCDSLGLTDDQISEIQGVLGGENVWLSGRAGYRNGTLRMQGVGM